MSLLIRDVHQHEHGLGQKRCSTPPAVPQTNVSPRGTATETTLLSAYHGQIDRYGNQHHLQHRWAKTVWDTGQCRRCRRFFAGCWRNKQVLRRFSLSGSMLHMCRGLSCDSSKLISDLSGQILEYFPLA